MDNTPRRADAVPLARGIVFLAGGIYTALGAALLFAPAWFYAYIGDFPPFNRHYAGDLGAFTLAVGTGLLAAAWDPVRHRGIVGVGVIASILHASNHLYDALASHGHPHDSVAELAGFFVLAIALLWAYVRHTGPTRVGRTPAPAVIPGLGNGSPRRYRK